MPSDVDVGRIPAIRQSRLRDAAVGRAPLGIDVRGPWRHDAGCLVRASARTRALCDVDRHGRYCRGDQLQIPLHRHVTPINRISLVKLVVAVQLTRD